MDQQQAMAQVAAMALGSIEKAVDDEIERIDNMGEDDFARIRRLRIEEMKAKALEKEQWRRNDHGSLAQITDQKEFFEACKKSKRCVCLFYRDGNKWCDVLSNHFQLLANKHMEAKFMKVNAENSPFLVERLNIWMMPTIVCTNEGKVHCQFNGLDEIDPTGKFETATLEFALHSAGMLDDTPLVDSILEREADEEDDDDEY
mmetsp:Transcript_15350/g.44911  ORF Transcript_15350/g.44911 Transcript_15350/m.44911 type:complete len:202 (-) Transcript_15350:603-1208(-)